MRKGYGPTHVSYYLPLERFTEMVKKGISIAQGVDENNKVLFGTLPQNLSENSIKRIYDDADCVCYHDGVQMIIPRHLA